MIVNKLYNKKMLLVNSIPKGDIAIVDNKVGLKDMTKVSVTIDKKLLQQLNRYEEKKIKIIFEVIAKSDEYLQITITDGINKIETKGEKLQKSITTPITKENIIKQLSKLGNTPFELEDIKIYMDPNIFISLKELNDIRRNLVEQLIEKRTYVPQKRINYVESLNTSSDKPVKISALVRTEEQLLACLDNNINYIYVTDTVLFNKYSNYSNIYLRMPRVMDNYKEMEEKNILACELGTVWKYSNNNNVCTDYYLNINNNNSIKTLEKLGVKRICLSPEIREFDKIISTSEVEMIVYGRLELMITKYCPLNMILNNDSKKCTVCMKKDKFYIKDDQNRMYPLLHNKHITHVMHYKNIDLIDNILEYKNKNINCFRLELFEENYLQTSNLISTMKGRLYE